MYQKFIIVSSPGERGGYLRLGSCINHRDLVLGYEKVHGGGWYLRDDEKKSITLYGSSCDFGSADFRRLKLIDREFKGYTFIFTPILNLPGNVLDLSDVEWI